MTDQTATAKTVRVWRSSAAQCTAEGAARDCTALHWQGGWHARETWLSESVYTKPGSSPVLSGVERKPKHDSSPRQPGMLMRNADGTTNQYTR